MEERRPEQLQGWQVRNLECGVGCVQCGRTAVATTSKGHLVCQNKACRKYVRRVESKMGLRDLLLHELSGCKIRDLN